MLERPTAIPDTPGSYQFKDADGRVIYVGKAQSLRSRLASYFQDRAALHPRTVQMLEAAASVEWIQVRSDVEAIMLEYNLIKANRPRFNVRLVDDKSYPYLAVTLDEVWPRAVVLRGAKRKGTRYFGPYAHAWAIRETLDLLLRSFPVRTCSNAKFNRHERLGRPCLLFHIERCSGPCVAAVDHEDYDKLLAELMAFLDGETGPIVARLEQAMAAAAADLEYELAARLRDQLATVRLASERQEMVAEADEDLDVVGVEDGELEAAVQVLHVRRGRVVGRQGLVLEKVEPLTPPELVGRVLEQLYAETPLGMPSRVLVPELPEPVATYESWLSERGGRRVVVHVPRRGRRAALLGVARENAAEQLTRHRMRRATDLSSRARALEELQSHLGLATAPLRIECYDMSHLQGSDYVGSMVVMEDGLPKRSDYRRFKVSAVQGNDDFGAMREVLTRRLRHLLDTPAIELEAAPVAPVGASLLEEPDTGEARDAAAQRGALDDALGVTRRPTRFAYPPQLLLLDGGKGQLSVGIAVLEELGLTGRVELAALAKQFEEVYRPDWRDPIRIPRDSEAIYLLQQVRDEAHRFAISFHRELRAKRMTRGALDGIPGLGPERRRRLVAAFGGVTKVRAASLEELMVLTWLPDRVAETVYAHLHPERPSGPSMPSAEARRTDPPGEPDAERDAEAISA